MIGLLAVEAWKKANFHCRNHMNIIILITNGKEGSKQHF
jgi:hypothetical protein